MPGAFRLRGELDPALLGRAFTEIVRRHATLRTTFPEVEGRPVQRVAPPAPARPLPRVDLAGLEGSRRTAALRTLLGRESRRPFDLAAGPLVRTFLADLGPRHRALFLNLHHIVSDGWSMGLLVRELTTLYDAFSRGLPSPLPELPLQYAEHAARERQRLAGGLIESRLEHWRRRLDGAPATVELPWDRSRPPVRSARGGRWPVRLAAPAAGALQAVAREGGASPFMALLATFALLLSRLGGGEDLVVGTPIANRDRRETEGMIGLLLNTLALRVDLSGEPSFRELLARVRRSALDAFAHAELPFERLVEELAPGRSLEHTPLFQVMLVLQGRVEDPGSGGGLAVERLEVEGGSAKFDLLLDLAEAGGGFAGSLEYSADLFDRTTAGRMARTWALLAGAAAVAPDLPVGALAVLAPAERHQLRHEWGPGGELPAAGAATIHGLFRRQAARTPEAVAVAGGLTYRRLAERADAVARRLRALGVGPETLVGVCLEREPGLPAALLGILAAGGAYLPLDPAYPEARLAYMLRDAGAPVVVTREALAARLPDGGPEGPGPRLLLLDGLAGEGAEDEAHGPTLPERAAPEVPPGALAYVVYTSGSTGRPKGVAITHGSAVAMLAWAREAFPEAAAGGVLAATSISFDLSVFELFLPLATGGTVVLARDALALAEAARGHDVRLVNTVPSAMAELVRLGELPPSVETVNLAGEALHRELAEAVYGAGRVRRVVNLYGPSEDTTYSTFAAVEPGGRGAPAIGRPVAGSRACLLDPRGRPVSAGVAGELVLAGAGLARGYLGRPAATAERFVPDSFAGGAAPAGARAYRTGDLARYRGDGQLGFLGRLDAQVKLRGYRIEPGEVAAALAAHPAVREAAAVVREDRPGDRRLVAYAVAEEGRAEELGRGLAAGGLRAFLAASLPEPMLPAAVVALERLPRTPSGKVDRRALAGPEHAPAGRDAALGAAPLRGGTEELLAEVWRDVLGVEAVAAGADFFALGGHSLLAARLVSRVRRVLGVELPLRAAFRHPTLRAQAAEVDRLRGRAVPAPPIRPVAPPGERPARFPLSFSQERLWFLDQLEPTSAAYNLPTVLRFRGALSAPALAAAAAGLLRRHEVLRTVFTGGRDEPAQVVGPPPPAAGLVPVVDLSRLPPAAAREEARRRARGEARRPFDLARGPLVRFRLLRAAPDDHLLVLVVHHAVSDGWSGGVIGRELGVLYEARRRGSEPRLPELPVQYGDFAAWQRGWLSGAVLERLIGDWKERLGPGPHVLRLPTDRPRPPVQTYRGARATRRLPAGLAGRLREIALARGATPFMAWLALFQILLARVTGDGAVSVGVPVANRDREEIEPLVGFFVNTLVLRTELAEETALGEVLETVREVTLDAYARQDLPFEKLVEELAPERSLAHPPLFQVLFVYQNVPQASLELPGIEVSAPFDPGTGATKVDLTLELHEADGGLALGLEYNTDLFDATTAARMLGHYEALARAAVARPEVAVGALPVLLAGERHQALLEWNDTARTPEGAAGRETLVDRIAARIAAAPDDLAIVATRAGPLSGRERLTYGELGDWAGRLAGRLRAAGVGPEVPVGVALGRSADLPVALLAVLAAGGFYVPLDPAYPEERLALMLADSGSRLVVTEEGAAERLPAGVEALRLDAEREAIGGLPPAPLAGPPHPDHLAWVIYTSGSTGKPKGVGIRHRSAAALLAWGRGVFPEGAGGAILAGSSISFDLSAFELFLPLSAGGTTVIAPSVLHLVEAAEAAAGHPVRHVNTVPSAMAELVRGGLLPPEVETVSTAGERQSRELVEAIYRAGRVRRVVNLYGPSEDTVYSTFAPVASDPGGSPPPIGRPLTQRRAYLLDAAARPVPRGVTGEVVLGGVGLARGYLGRPARTAERFVPDPFGPAGSSGAPGARLYRSGDLARHRGDGQLLFVRRRDLQVKLRGFRIEPGEVEAALREHPAVAAAAAAVRTGAGPEDLRLVAYVVPAAGAGPLDAGELVAWLGRKLPAYMVPSAVVELDRLPLTGNGKLDRRALPDPGSWGVGAGAEPVPPRTETERSIARIWQEVLGRETVGVDDNFFDLGGHSLLMVRVYHRLKADLGRELPLVATFAHPTVASLAAYLDGAGGAEEARRGGEERGERRRRAALAARARRSAGRDPRATEDDPDHG